MSEDRPLFILAGNGPYENRGCEAIVRGTVKILREYFHDPRFVCLSHFQSEEQYGKQCLNETDDTIIHLTSNRLSKKKVARNVFKPEIWRRIFQYYFNQGAFNIWVYENMLPYLGDSIVVLSIGGDNYSLDYGVPKIYTALDDLVLNHGKPIVLWGVSVGPFSAIPDYEGYMSQHLQKLTGIFARESETISYLESIGVTRNVHPVADPAFLMDPVKPKEEVSIEDGAIGINLSPLMARYVTGGDVERWRALAAAIIEMVAKRTEKPIYLIPHVTSPHSDDYDFMQKAISRLSHECRNLTLIPPKYNAAEIKWIISQMELFAGSRTHSTIASLSSGVPTLSFAYSVKALGINKDIFGHIDYCLNPTEIDTRDIITRIILILERADEIRKNLDEQIPKIQLQAFNAGKELREFLKGF